MLSVVRRMWKEKSGEPIALVKFELNLCYGKLGRRRFAQEERWRSSSLELVSRDSTISTPDPGGLLVFVYETISTQDSKSTQMHVGSALKCY